MEMNQIRKAYAISDARISFVSLVDKAANQREFLITKAAGGKAEFACSSRIIKSDTKTHYLTGIVYEPLAEDIHGNYMTEDEIRKAAYWFARNGDRIDLQHNFTELDKASVVENYVAPCEMQIGSELVKKGTWIMTVQVEDPVIWQAVEKGEITGFSMGGSGRYSETDTDPDSLHRTADDIQKSEKGIVKRLAEMMGYEFVRKNEKEAAEAPKQEEAAVTKEELQEMIDSAVAKALEPFLKATGTASNLNEEQPVEKSYDTHYLTGIL